MKVAVLGASGFLGSYICHNLRNHVIYPVTRSTLVLTDYVSVSSWIDLYQPDVVVNCATAGGKTRLGDCNYQDLQNNLSIFLNFYNLRNRFGKFINIGSGAEFDKSKSIDRARESDILTSAPQDSYSLSKNIIARTCQMVGNFYTIRLFGVFDSTEPDFRLLKKCQTQSEITIQNAEFDMLSASDFLRVLRYYIENDNLAQDINCVYQQKQDLESIVRRFASIHNNKLRIEVQTPADPKNYTGDGSTLAEMGIDLAGLDQGLENYR
jgi:nucleoside-diphosphate-sugar epimerase